MQYTHDQLIPLAKALHANGVSMIHIAMRYGLTQGQAAAAIAGQPWSPSIKLKRRKLSVSRRDVQREHRLVLGREAIARLHAGDTIRAIAATAGVSRMHVYQAMADAEREDDRNCDPLLK